MMHFVLVEAPTYRRLVEELNVVCQGAHGLRPHGPAFEHAGRVMQIMVHDVELPVPADNPYVSVYSDGLTDEGLSAKVARRLSQGYVLWGPQGGDENGSWQVMVARSAIGGGV